MSTAARRRLMRDFKVRHHPRVQLCARCNTNIAVTRAVLTSVQRMQMDPPAGVSASPIADNVMTWYDSPHPPRTRHPYPRSRSLEAEEHKIQRVEL
jgi:hypothetical protein